MKYCTKPILTILLAIPLSLVGSMSSSAQNEWLNFSKDQTGNVVESVKLDKYGRLYFGSESIVYEVLSTETEVSNEGGRFMTFTSKSLMEQEGSYNLGDPNNDGEINITDLSITIDYALGRSPEGCIQLASDLNKDGNINVTDVSMVISYIFSGKEVEKTYSVMSSQTRLKSKDGEVAEEYMYISEHNADDVALCVSNIEDYVSMQFDIRFVEGFSVSGIELTGDGTDKHVLYSLVEDNLYRVLVFSDTNANFSPECRFVLHAVLDQGTKGCKVELDDLLLTKRVPENRLMSMACEGLNIEYELLGTDEIEIDKTPDELRPIYNIKGQRMSDASVSGVYIIGDQKVLIK